MHMNAHPRETLKRSKEAEALKEGRYRKALNLKIAWQKVISQTVNTKGLGLQPSAYKLRYPNLRKEI